MTQLSTDALAMHIKSQLDDRSSAEALAIVVTLLAYHLGQLDEEPRGRMGAKIVELISFVAMPDGVAGAVPPGTLQ